MTHLRSYKMTVDTGFAPNPYENCLTLATCKPWIRKNHKIGQWLAGFTSQKLNGDPPGQERLVFLAVIDQKMTLGEYYKKYPQKRVGACAKADNIYEYKNGEYYQHPNKFHNQENKSDDLKGENVLIANEFYYFGGDALALPLDIRPIIPKGQSRYGYMTKGQGADIFINFVKDKVCELYPGEKGILAEPHKSYHTEKLKAKGLLSRIGGKKAGRWQITR